VRARQRAQTVSHDSSIFNFEKYISTIIKVQRAQNCSVETLIVLELNVNVSTTLQYLLQIGMIFIHIPNPLAGVLHGFSEASWVV
jgi:hypothetical protein